MADGQIFGGKAPEPETSRVSTGFLTGRDEHNVYLSPF